MEFRWLFIEVSVHVDIDHRYMKQGHSGCFASSGELESHLFCLFVVVFFFSFNRTWYFVSVAKT